MEKMMVTSLCVTNSYPFPSLVIVNEWWLSRAVAAMGVIIVVVFFS